jgi:hypothetical protein
MNSKEYVMPDGKKAVFEYDSDGIGKVTIEAMDMLMGLITDGRKCGEWIRDRYWSRGTGMGEEYGFFYKCSMCECEVENGYTRCGFNFCPNCGARMKGASNDSTC